MSFVEGNVCLTKNSIAVIGRSQSKYQGCQKVLKWTAELSK